MHSLFHKSLALRFDHRTRQFESVPLQNLSWSVTDAGTQYSAILVERFRTYAFKLLELDDHVARLNLGAQCLAIDASIIESRLTTNATRLIDLNRDLVHRCGDVSIVVLLSPGEQHPEIALGKRPTCMMHLSPLPFAKLNQWYQHGTDLWIGSNHSVPNSCWPNQIKSRSRLPYFLSDASLNESQSSSLSVLTTTRKTISDTSVANLLLVDDQGNIVSPPKQDILMGCTLQAVERLLHINGVQIHYRDIEPRELVRAREIILTGSNGGVWSASSINGTRIGFDTDQPKLRMLTNLWKSYVGMDYVEQAAKKAE